jgi:hypothetical protein
MDVLCTEAKEYLSVNVLLVDDYRDTIDALNCPFG